MTAVILFWWLALGQTPADRHIEEAPAAGEYPLIFELKRGFTTPDGRTSVVGYVDDPNWENGRSVLVKLDEPWANRSTSSITLNTSDIQDAIPEVEDEWRARHLAGWESAGYVNVGTGETFYFVLRTEAERAREARELVAAQSPGLDALPAEVVAEADSDAMVAAQSPGWVKHFVVSAIGLVLAAVVLKTLVLQ